MPDIGIPTWRLLLSASEKLRNMHSRKNIKNKDGENTISLSQVRVLGCLLIGDEDGIKVKKLAAELGITPGGVSQIVDTLVHMGYVERAECPFDRRSVVIRLSESGTKLRKMLDRDFKELFDYVFEDVTAEEQHVFRSVLFKLINTADNDIHKQE